MDDLYELEKINSSQRTEVGEKAIALNQLFQLGFPIPSGIVVGSQVLARLLGEENGFSPFSQCNLDLSSYQALQETAQQLSEQVTKAELGKKWWEELEEKIADWETTTVILRPCLILPSAQAPVSGLLESQCVPCATDQIEWGLKQVWQSLFRARSLFYWQQQNLDWEELGLAVMIQPIASAIASGTLKITETQWQIQAVRGLGHSLVRGEVLPETYEINPKTQAVQLHQRGYQTRIYYLNPLLEVKSLTEEAGEEILTSEQISQLIQVAKQLHPTINQQAHCEWTFFPQSLQQRQKSTSQLYLTQFSVREKTPTEVTVSAPSAPNLILKGIGAATGRATGNVYVIGKDDKQVFPSGGILVAKNITTKSLPLVKSAAGLITEWGGMTSHGAILARELKIPAVVGVQGATDTLQTEEAVTVDGEKGEVLRPSLDQETPVEEDFSEKRETPPLATQLMVNASQPDRAVELAQSPVDGVGLLRSELMLLELLGQNSLETWLSRDYREAFIEQLASLIGQFASAFFPRPIFYRSTDWLSLQEEDSAFLGERGTYSYLQNSDFFSAQMFALQHLQQQGYTNINLILPFVRSVEEVKFCKKLLTEMGLKDTCQIWIMAEVPSVVYLLPAYIEAGVEGITIGTNDLTQLLLGVDREQGELRKKYNECHPAMLTVLKTLITKAREGGIPCSICGQGVVLYPDLVEKLVRWGITGISVEESGIETVSSAIARSEKRILLEAARKHIQS